MNATNEIFQAIVNSEAKREEGGVEAAGTSVLLTLDDHTARLPPRDAREFQEDLSQWADQAGTHEEIGHLLDTLSDSINEANAAMDE